MSESESDYNKRKKKVCKELHISVETLERAAIIKVRRPDLWKKCLDDKLSISKAYRQIVEVKWKKVSVKLNETEINNLDLICKIFKMGYGKVIRNALNIYYKFLNGEFE